MDYALTLRIGRWMITNGDFCQGRGLRLCREEAQGPGSATCRWVAVFPKAVRPPVPRPLTKAERDAETGHVLGRITTVELQRIRQAARMEPALRTSNIELPTSNIEGRG